MSARAAAAAFPEGPFPEPAVLEAGGHRVVVELVPACAGGGAGTAVSVRAAEAPAEGPRAGDGPAGRSASAVVLRNALVGHAEMVLRNGREHHLLDFLPSAVSAEEAGARIEEVRRRLPDLLAPAASVAAGAAALPPGCINLLWWDERANFGDAVGPWLAGRITGRTPVNGWQRGLDIPPLAAVGSTAGWLEQDGTRVWGAGLMRALDAAAVERLAKLRGIRVHAVRGKLTAAELRSRLGWTVPEIYGDPALLLPRFLPAPVDSPSRGKIAVVPHLDHRGILAQPEGPAQAGQHGRPGPPERSGPGSAEIHVVDARQGMEAVVGEIAGARACISSSLHGIIVAQAYGVPWVWVRIEDALIAGDTFKFQDFFTTLDASAVSAVSVTAARARRIDPVQLARSAALPQLRISLETLLDAFPADLAAGTPG